jgi:hypothetical protein
VASLSSRRGHIQDLTNGCSDSVFEELRKNVVQWHLYVGEDGGSVSRNLQVTDKKVIQRTIIFENRFRKKRTIRNVTGRNMFYLGKCQRRFKMQKRKNEGRKHPLAQWNLRGGR